MPFLSGWIFPSPWLPRLTLASMKFPLQSCLSLNAGDVFKAVTGFNSRFFLSDSWGRVTQSLTHAKLQFWRFALRSFTCFCMSCPQFLSPRFLSWMVQFKDTAFNWLFLMWRATWAIPTKIEWWQPFVFLKWSLLVSECDVWKFIQTLHGFPCPCLCHCAVDWMILTPCVLHCDWSHCGHKTVNRKNRHCRLSSFHFCRTHWASKVFGFHRFGASTSAVS